MSDAGQTPESFTIPMQLIERWSAVPEAAAPAVELRRADWDALYSAFDKSLFSQAALSGAIGALSVGNNLECHQKLSDATKYLIESQNAWRRFFMGVMASGALDTANG